MGRRPAEDRQARKTPTTKRTDKQQMTTSSLLKERSAVPLVSVHDVFRAATSTNRPAAISTG